jgi:hypothetical protein
MAAPTVISVSPNPGATDVVLGTAIIITFDQPMLTSSINPSTFSLTGPGDTQFVSPTEINNRFAQPATGREYINGSFAFSTNGSSNTVFTFTPSVPLRPNVIYTVMIVGAGNISASGSVVTNNADPVVALNSTNVWTFTTGNVNTTIPPITSPIPLAFIPLDPCTIKIQEQVWAVGNDLSQVITIVFPGIIDTTTINPSQILLSLEAILDDPSVIIPTGLTNSVVISGNTITITISGWPSS